mgnify:CR=1 FL=1
MATLMYYFSANACASAPPSSDLLSIDAESSLDAICKLRDNGGLPTNGQSSWEHVLVWTADNGRQRGFESMSLADHYELVG